MLKKPLLKLSRREQEVSLSVKRHDSRKETASLLGISESTVKFHEANILRKVRQLFPKVRSLAEGLAELNGRLAKDIRAKVLEHGRAIERHSLGVMEHMRLLEELLKKKRSLRTAIRKRP